MRQIWSRFLFGCLAIFLASCSLDTFRRHPPPHVTGEPETLQYASELGVRLSDMTKTASGLYYLDRRVGDSVVAQPGNRVRVAYRGWLADGKLFDQSGAGQPIEFVLGQGRVIPGWDEGIAGMRAGGHRLLVIRPGLAYGDQSPGGGIPPGATLVFDVTLVGVEK
jgi:FKBP-type peptidyl-prolyl cis-trans isomerase FkpA